MKNVGTLLFIAVLVSGTAATVFGDGVVFSGQDYSSMEPIEQDEQRAVIIHRNGVEKMLITVSLYLENEDRGFWIFPVPGNPETVKLDVLDSFPVFKGVEPLHEVDDIFGDIAKLTLATQIYPLPFIMEESLAEKRPRGTTDFEVPTYCEVEKWGIHTEAVSADSIEDLRDYLEKKGVGIKTEELKAFEDYLSDKYVLVLAWISSRKELLEKFEEYGKGAILSDERWPCLYVEFATEKAFYPVRPTRSYGEERISIELTILDYVQIDGTYPRIDTEYCRQSGAVENVPSKMVTDLSSKDIRYTRIDFYSEARNLNNDLWFIQGAPKKVKNAESFISVLSNPFVYFVVLICLVLFFSWLTAGLTGLVLFQRWQGYAQLGLWNILTLIGLCIASYKVKGTVGERFSQTDRFPGRWTFNILFSIFYLFIVCYFLFVFKLVLDYFLI
ncbi:MAG: hypothetical protein JW947_08930 [Sedimentisphaerales bacterium]|nr:hypothetical protein [Sedimentisphaerales bacterium]